METFYLKSSVKAQSEEKIIYVAGNGQGYYANNELHIADSNSHYVYKFSKNNKGWYMKNTQTSTDYFLGKGACPTVSLENIDIKDTAYWEEISFVPEQNNDNASEEIQEE